MRWASRILAILAAVTCAATTAFALDTPMLWGGSSVPSNSATNYTYVYGNSGSWNATEVNVRSIVPIAGSFKNLRIIHDAAPTSGKSFAYTVVKNGSDTGITCTIANANTSCTDLVTSPVSFAAGDTVSVKSVPSGTPTQPTTMQIGLVFSATTATDAIIIGNTRTTSLSNTTTQYGLLGGAQSPSATLNLRDSVAPTSGTIDKLYVELAGTPGVGTGYTFTVWKNGATTNITCDVTGTGTTCNDTTHSTSVAADDTLAIQFSVQSGTPTARVARWGVRWVPDTAGEIIVLNNGATSPNTGGATRYSPPAGGSQSWNTTEPATNVVIPGSYTLKKWHIKLNTDPSPGSYTFKSRKNSADGGQSFTISSGSTSNTPDSSTDSLVAGDILDSSAVSASSPASSVSKWGWVFLDPNGVPTPTPTPTNTPTATPTNTPTPTPTATPTVTPTATVEPAGGLPMMGVGS